MKMLYNLNEAACALGISRKTLEREMNAGRFPRPLKIASSCLVSAKDMEGYISMLENVREKNDGTTDWMKALKYAERLPQPAAKFPFAAHHEEYVQQHARTYHPNDPKRLP